MGELLIIICVSIMSVFGALASRFPTDSAQGISIGIVCNSLILYFEVKARQFSCLLLFYCFQLALGLQVCQRVVVSIHHELRSQQVLPELLCYGPLQR